MTATKSLVFRIGDVEVRESEYSVIRQGKVLAIEPKAFRVLLLLLRNPQRVVSKEELLNDIWGDAALTENSLARSVLKLRTALNDDARELRYIETLATVGYRLICHVDAREEPVGLLVASPKGTGIVQPRSRTDTRQRLRSKWRPPPRLRLSTHLPEPSASEVTGQLPNRLVWLFVGFVIAGIAVAAGW